MAQKRVELDNILRTTLGSSNVYFDPPETIKLKYPCIIYSLEGNTDMYADNKTYYRYKRYSMIYITQNADDPMADTLSDINFCKLVRYYTADNLYHYAFEIFY